MINLTALENELTTDPNGLGYAAHINAGNIATVADLLNATTGPGAAPVSRGTVSRGVILRGIVPALDQLASGLDTAGAAINNGMQNKWRNRFDALRSGDQSIDLDAPLTSLLNQLGADKLMTQGAIDALVLRPGSRAENLFGPGTVVTPLDVHRSLNKPEVV